MSDKTNWKVREVKGPAWPGQRGFVIDWSEDQEQVTDFIYDEDDAYLMAAAPDLLESLEEVLNLFAPGDQQRMRVLVAARAAIAKARGGA